MSLRQRFIDSFDRGKNGDLGDFVRLISKEPAVVRHLLGMTYHPDRSNRELAIRGLGIAAKHHPALVQEVIRRLVWAMNDESGTNGLTAPDVLCAVAREMPEILLPFIADLSRLAGDPGLHNGLKALLRQISEAFPGEVGQRMGKELSRGRRRISR